MASSDVMAVQRIPSPSILDTGTLPLAELADFARRESSGARAIYGGHRWFARRFGSATRALLVAAATPEGDDFWNAYYDETGDGLTDCRVLDCFMGGGTIAYEAQRLGASVTGIDVDPVAVAVSSFELDAISFPDPAEGFDEIWRQVGKDLSVLYRTWANGEERIGLHYLWSQVVDCADCGDRFDVRPSSVLGKTKDGRWVLCPACGDVFSRKNSKRVRCGCGHRFDPLEGNVTRGEARCECGHSEPLIEYSRRTGRRPNWELAAIESVPITERKNIPIADRIFHRPTDKDLALYAAAETELADWEVPGWPITAAGRSDDRVLSYKYDDYQQLFNARQLLHLAKTASAISGMEEPWKQMLGLALSNHSLSSNMMCSYSAKWRQATPLFAIRSYRHVPRPVEVNPWLTNAGRGTFPNTVRRVAKAISYAKNPKELTKNGVCFLPARPAGDHDIRVGDSRDLSHIQDASIDLVLTDPPYLDNIAYDELSEFFRPWLTASGVLERQANNPAKATVAVRKRSAAAAAEFSELIEGSFAEIRRVLARGGRLAFTFQHTRPRAWHAIAVALRQAGLEVVQVFPIKADSNQGFHNHQQTSTWDAVLVSKRGRVRTGEPKLSATQVDKVNAHTDRLVSELKLAAPDEHVLRRAALTGASTGFLSAANGPQLTLIHCLTAMPSRVDGLS